MTTKHFCDICGCQSSESGLQRLSIAVFLSGENEHNGLNESYDICTHCRIDKMYEIKQAVSKAVKSFQIIVKEGSVKQ